MKRFIVLFTAALLFIGCGNTEQGNQGTEASAGENMEQIADNSVQTPAEGYSFTYQGVVISMNAEAAPIIEALGEPIDYFEAPSCAFQGLDKIYYYSGFELGTYPDSDKDYVSYVNLLDDTVSTEQGISLGQPLVMYRQFMGRTMKRKELLMYILLTVRS